MGQQTNTLNVQYRECVTCNEEGQSSTAEYEYGIASDYQSRLVADDYGPRQINSDLYDWHGGIDFNSAIGDGDRGDLILAIEPGQISGALAPGYKRLFVNGDHNFGYGHLFWGQQSNTQSGGCFLKEMILQPGQYATVIKLDGDVYTIGPNVGSVEFEGEILEVSTQISSVGDPIGPTGGSSNGGEYYAHLHLYSNPGGNSSTGKNITKNPLQYIDYDMPDFDLSVLSVVDYADNETTDWSECTYSQSSRNTIVVRPTMDDEGINERRYDAILDVNRVELQVKRAFESEVSYTVVTGNEADASIRLGGRIGENVDPEGMHYDSGDGSIGNLQRQGIRPFAYATHGAHPYDDFYFTDVYFRIHREDDIEEGSILLAELPDQARYQDGPYNLRGKLYRVTFDENEDDEDDPEKTETSDPVSFNIDNFQPFLKEVNIHLNGIQVYHLAWLPDECGGMKYVGGALFDNLGTLSEDDFNYNLDIEVFTSESMRFLDLNIEAFGKLVAEDDLTLLNHSADRTYFSWRVDPLAEYQSTANSGFALQNLLAFSFWGEDYPVSAEAEAGNKLLQLGAFFDPMNVESNNQQTCVSLPHRVAIAPFPTFTHFGVPLPGSFTA